MRLATESAELPSRRRVASLTHHPGVSAAMPAHLSDTLAERIRAAARRLPALPVDVVEVLRGVFAHPTSRDGDAA